MRHNPEFGPETLTSLELALKQYELMRMDERITWGEDIDLGPGYAQCIAHYFIRELGDLRPNNLLLDRMAEVLGLPRDRTVPVLQGSLDAGQSLAGLVQPETMVQLSNFLDAVVCRSAADAQELRSLGPTILPYELTKHAIRVLDNGGMQYHSRLSWALHREERDYLSRVAVVGGPFKREQVTLNLGGEEVIRSICRLQQITYPDGWRAFIPLPNYTNAIRSIAALGGEVTTSPLPNVDAWAADIARLKPDLIYLSNPNNPLGTTLKLPELAALLQATPAETLFVLDQVGVDLDQPNILRGHKLAAKFPKRRMVIVDSESKRANLSDWRIGYGYCTKIDDARALRRFEPPFLVPGIRSLMTDLFDDYQAVHWSAATMNAFHDRLRSIAHQHPNAITVPTARSNFTTVEFRDPELQQRYLEALVAVDPRTIGAKAILGRPKVGAGDLTADQLGTDQQLSTEQLADPGILGLPKNAVRLSALSHQFVLDVLARVLK